jgi:hypothetical protein
MGAYNSKEELKELQEQPLLLTPFFFPYGAWHYEKPKNFNYYFTDKRCFRVSRKHYPQYTRGTIYGYYEDLDYWDKLSNEESNEIEREF